MFLRLINKPISNLYGVGKEYEKALARLGIFRVNDLLVHFPRDWEDRRKVNPLKNYLKGKVCAKVKVIGKEKIGFRNTEVLKVYIKDETAQAALLCYNRDYLDKVFVKGNEYWLWGNFSYKYGELQSSSFEYEDINLKKSFGKIIPVYPLTEGLTQKKIRLYLFNALKQYKNNIDNELPQVLIEKHKLLPKNTAINAMHFPESFEELELARKTLIYEELFYLEIMVCKRARERRKNKNFNAKDAEESQRKELKVSLNSSAKLCVTSESSALNLNISKLQNNLINKLPFELTCGQKEAIKEINNDMNSGFPMARLLQGDVGSGKTLVSFMAALGAIEKSGQAAIMAPTELLARQHAETAARLLENLGVNVAFFTGNVKAAGRKELLKNLKAGEIDIIIGTHALFSKDVEYKNLSLVVIDEQHRFGVTQRALIMSKGTQPNLLMMSATPIPRTLALTVFGDMDVSIIRDMPLGRKSVITHLAKESNEKKVYDFVKKELEKGRQAYFVYPLIEEGDSGIELKDAVSMSKRLSKEIFPDFKTALIHSKLEEEKKQKTMEDFRSGKIQILCATSVVEVGVDVANASCMIVEHAERFGLSALHQLRGRVGRGTEQSYCFLVYSDDLTEDGKARLKVMMENNDGFVIAEEDLKLRGPGQIAGKEQSGYLELGIANPIRDYKLLELARNDAFAILENDPDLLLSDHRVIAKVLEEAPPFSEVTL